MFYAPHCMYPEVEEEDKMKVRHHSPWVDDVDDDRPLIIDEGPPAPRMDEEEAKSFDEGFGSVEEGSSRASSPSTDASLSRVLLSPPRKDGNAGRQSASSSSRRARLTWSRAQLSSLESYFSDINSYPRNQDCQELASLLCVTARNVQIWFTNRRAKYKRDWRVGAPKGRRSASMPRPHILRPLPTPSPPPQPGCRVPESLTSPPPLVPAFIPMSQSVIPPGVDPVSYIASLPFQNIEQRMPVTVNLTSPRDTYSDDSVIESCDDLASTSDSHSVVSAASPPMPHHAWETTGDGQTEPLDLTTSANITNDGGDVLLRHTLLHMSSGNVNPYRPWEDCQMCPAL